MAITDSSLPPLEWVRSFEAAARRESFTLAAEELGLTQAAVSQQIRKLEARLGTPLFRRLPRGVELTADGAAYLPHVRAAFSVLARGTGDLFGDRRRHTVSIAAPASVVALWLSPRLAAFASEHPHIRLSVASIHRPADYDAVKADLEIRFGTGEWTDRTATLLLPERLSPVCAPALREAAPDLDWPSLPAIAVAGPRDGWAEWSTRTGMAPPSRVVLRFDSFASALEATKAGAGVLLASLPLCRTALESGALARLSEVELAMTSGHWLLRPDRLHAPAAVERTFRWLAGLGEV